MAEVVVNTRLHLGEVVRLVDALDIEELGDGPEVCEATGQRPGAEASQAVADIEPRRQHVYRNLNS